MSRLLDVHNFVADKLRWQTQVLLDGGLTANARMVGALLAHDLNVERGAAWRSQENMALALQVSLSSVRRGLAELAAAGHLSVRRSRGRGKTQHYAALILDGIEAHDSIDKAIAARRGRMEGVAPVNGDASEKVAPVNGDPAEKVAPVSGEVAEKVAPAARKVFADERQTLYESLNPPLPPQKANRVRERWGADQCVTIAPFPDTSVRAAVVCRLGEAGVRSWLDPHGWDPASRTIVCRLEGAATKLARECGSELRAVGASVVFDKPRFAALMRKGRPVMAEAVHP